MDTFRKWLNKPKADDNSLLARFYHADRNLTEVANELDSFDGRAEPDRCSRLVSRLRQNQDKVLAITNQIMQELLGDDRDPRVFRAKFPEEVLQENLAGQLWFGAECLAAGSSIMNREQESKEMRPLAQAVTKSLGNVRNLLRDQCLRNNVPNSRTLQLDINDAATEQLCESLKIFDRLFAEFELRYVSAMVQVKTKHEYEMQELICVLFSETLQRALKIGLLEQDQVDTFDPALMFSIPRLAIVTGLVIFDDGPLNMAMDAEDLSEMFRPFRTILIKIRDLLRTLRPEDLFHLERLLCTNEEMKLKDNAENAAIENQNKNLATKPDEAQNNADQNQNVACGTLPTNNTKSISSSEAIERERSSLRERQDAGCRRKKMLALRTSSRLSVSSISTDSSPVSRPSLSPPASPTHSHSIISTVSSVAGTSDSTSVVYWTDDARDDTSDEDSSAELERDGDMMTADCATGYLIPNTNLGNLLQQQEVPLTGNLIASEDEYGNQNTNDEAQLDVPSTSNFSKLQLESTEHALRSHTQSSEGIDHATLTPDKTSSSECEQMRCDSISASAESYKKRYWDHRRHNRAQTHEDTASENVVKTRAKDGHHHHRRHAHQQRHQHDYRRRHTVAKLQTFNTEIENGNQTAAIDAENWSTKRTYNKPTDTSTGDSSITSSLSDSEPKYMPISVRTEARLKYKNTDNLLHRLFVCIAGVADQLQTNFASDLRQILRNVFFMNVSASTENVNEVPEKAKDPADLFEFRASEQDVIQQSGGSNQSIYSAEEVNPELDNVFRNNNGCRNAQPGAVQRGNTNDSRSSSTSTSATTANNIASHINRSRSLGDQDNNANASQGIVRNNSIGSNYCNPQHNICISSNSPTNSVFSTSNSSGTSSGSHSPVSECVSDSRRGFFVANDGNAVTAHNNNNEHRDLSGTAAARESYIASPSSARLAPPVWIPDEKAPRCMSCETPFTAFRRRHHCRNCGGVFCNICSSSSAPLPKYGLTKAVRVCRACYLREVCAGNGDMHLLSNAATTSTTTTGVS